MYGFDYQRPASRDAAKTAASGADARYLAGGQSLIQAMRLRLSQSERLVDLGGIADLRTIKVDGNGVTVGAMATHSSVGAHADVRKAIPALAELAGNIASRGGYDPAPVLRQFGIDFIVLAPIAAEGEDAAGGAAVSTRAQQALDGSADFSMIGSSDAGHVTERASTSNGSSWTVMRNVGGSPSVRPGQAIADDAGCGDSARTIRGSVDGPGPFKPASSGSTRFQAAGYVIMIPLRVPVVFGPSPTG